MTTPGITICDLGHDILALICDEIKDDYVYARRFSRTSVKALSETCKRLRVAAARVVFHTLVIWNWDMLRETAQEMMNCGLALQYTRTLRVTPLLIRPMPEARYPFSMGIDTDPFLPKAGGTVRNNSDLFRRRREEGSPEYSLLYRPIARVENGVHTNILAEVEALCDLLLKFNNLTELIFGLGADATRRPPFEQSIRRMLGTTSCLSGVRALNIEDTALFWLSICPQLDDLTLYLGYLSGTGEWPTTPTVRKLTLHNTSCCHALGRRNAQLPPLSKESKDNDNRHTNCGPAITMAMPNVKVLDLVDCGQDFEAILASLSGFIQLEELRVHWELSCLLESPEWECGTSRYQRWMAMSDEERKAETDAENADKLRALNDIKFIVLKHFPTLERFRLGKKACYDFSMLVSRNDRDEVENLQPNPPVDLNDI